MSEQSPFTKKTSDFSPKQFLGGFFVGCLTIGATAGLHNGWNSSPTRSDGQAISNAQQIVRAGLTDPDRYESREASVVWTGAIDGGRQAYAVHEGRLVILTA